MEGSSTFPVLSGGDRGLELSSSGRVSFHSTCAVGESAGVGRMANVDILVDFVLRSCNCDRGKYLEGCKSIPGVSVLPDTKEE